MNTDGMSVIIPLHNGELWIKSTLAALASQTVSPTEVIVVDDGSTDEGVKIAERFQLADGSSPLVLRHEHPMGVAIARNHGAFYARGEWLGFCDDDDVWHPRRIECILDTAGQHPEAIAIASDARGFALETDRSVLEKHERGGMVNHWLTADDPNLLFENAGDVTSGAQRTITLADLQQDPCFVTTQVCFRRASYALAGGFAPWAWRSDDWILHAVTASIEPIVCLSAPLVFYRIRPSSESHNDSELALPVLATILALRFGGNSSDDRPAGDIFRHLIAVQAREGAPLIRTLAFGVLGDVGPRGLASLVKSRLRSSRRTTELGANH